MSKEQSQEEELYDFKVSQIGGSEPVVGLSADEFVQRQQNPQRRWTGWGAKVGTGALAC